MEVSSGDRDSDSSSSRCSVVVKERHNMDGHGNKNLLMMMFIIFSSNLLTFLVTTSIYSSCSLTSPILLAHLNNQQQLHDGDGEVDDIISTNNNNDDPAATSNNNNEKLGLLAAEYIAFTSPQLLPFGFSSNFDSDTIHPSVGSGCTQSELLDDLSKYMTYPVNGSCPDDELLAQKLLLGGCEPLPRRRCHPAAPPHYVQPYPLPTSLWSTPSDSSVVWTAYTCKNYDCLINRKHRQKKFDDCKDCFDLEGREKTRWTATGSTTNSLDFSIDEVLAQAAVTGGSIRIGLDIGGGVATFAVRMMQQRNITIVTTSMNFNGPFNSFIASRGVVPLYITISQRLPFFDNTLDIIHSMHVLSNWIPTSLLHFFLFDIYRVLRPGGLFWLDHFFCSGDQLDRIYAPLIQSVGFNKLKWVVGRKLDRGPQLQEMYLSALLQKPLNNSWSSSSLINQ